jgi:Zn finger protein HypA/HybF involved in hydrogenase expression
MGWNDHVSFADTECLECGIISCWEYWDDVGKERYVGAVGQLVNQDATRSDKCPHCGSTKGRIVPEDD